MLNLHVSGLMQHSYLGFVFKTVLQLAHRTQFILCSGNLSFVHICKPDASRIRGWFVCSHVHHNNSGRMTGVCRLLIPHSIVFINHTMNCTIYIEFPPVSSHPGQIMAEMDEDISKSLIIPHIIFDVVLRRGHTISAPKTDLIELNPLDIRTTEEHRSQGPIANR